jgi:hypothetical protein
VSRIGLHHDTIFPAFNKEVFEIQLSCASFYHENGRFFQVSFHSLGHTSFIRAASCEQKTPAVPLASMADADRRDRCDLLSIALIAP